MHPTLGDCLKAARKMILDTLAHSYADDKLEHIHIDYLVDARPFKSVPQGSRQRVPASFRGLLAARRPAPRYGPKAPKTDS